MDKLVRDLIPQIMNAAGARGRFRTASASERLVLLTAKLVEEAKEVADGPGVEELADLREVFLALQRELGITNEQLEIVREAKALSRGRFDAGIVLLGE